MTIHGAIIVGISHGMICGVASIRRVVMPIGAVQRSPTGILLVASLGRALGRGSTATPRIVGIGSILPLLADRGAVTRVGSVTGMRRGGMG